MTGSVSKREVGETEAKPNSRKVLGSENHLCRGEFIQDYQISSRFLFGPT